jgi:SAM-dependent methyltransferase
MKFNDPFDKRFKVQDIGRWYVTRFVKRAADTLPPGCRILDAGAGECAYKKHFAAHRYTSVDAAVGDPFWNYHNLDSIAQLDSLPFPDASFDAILSTQTLEHLEWPRESVREFHRVLKPGGTLYLTAPMAHKQHQSPHDFFRFTSFGLQSICRHAGFREIQVEPFGGLYVRWAYELPNCLAVFPSAGLKRGRPNLAGILCLPLRLLALALIRPLQLLLLALDSVDRAKDHPFGWSVIARK